MSVNENISVVPSHPLLKALRRNSDAATPLRYFQATNTEPVESTTFPPADPGGSIRPVGQGGYYAPQRLFIQPYCDGTPGSIFWMRLWGWHVHGRHSQTLVWTPVFLAEFWCRAGNL